jgi:hypothetical protein
MDHFRPSEYVARFLPGLEEGRPDFFLALVAGAWVGVQQAPRHREIRRLLEIFFV